MRCDCSFDAMFRLAISDAEDLCVHDAHSAVGKSAAPERNEHGRGVPDYFSPDQIMSHSSDVASASRGIIALSIAASTNDSTETATGIHIVASHQTAIAVPNEASVSLETQHASLQAEVSALKAKNKDLEDELHRARLFYRESLPPSGNHRGGT